MVKLNFDVKTHILKNGLEVITIKKNTQISSINIGIKVGALNESLEEKGISHYIEHMIFKGTKNRTFQKLNDELEALGGEYNAFTDYSQTVYSISCLEEELKNAIELLSDMLINSEFPEEEIDKERGVILAEIRSSKDNIEDISFKRVNEAAFEKSALRFDVAGLDKNVKGFNRNELYQYYKKYYVPNNSVIAISGNFNFDEIINKIEEKFKVWKKRDVNVDIKKAEFKSCFLTKNKDIEQVNLAMSLEAVPIESDKEVYALAVINTVFGGSISSRLFQKIREEKGLVYSIYSSQSLYRKCGELGIFASMSNEHLKEVYESIIEEIKIMKKYYLTDQEIKESKEQLKGSYILGLESTSSRMMSIGRALLLNNKVESTDDILKSIDNVDRETVKIVIDKIFNLDKLGVCIVGRDVEENKL